MKRLLWLFETACFIVLSFPLAILPHKIALKVGEILGLLVFICVQTGGGLQSRT